MKTKQISIFLTCVFAGFACEKAPKTEHLKGQIFVVLNGGQTLPLGDVAIFSIDLEKLDLIEQRLLREASQKVGLTEKKIAAFEEKAKRLSEIVTPLEPLIKRYKQEKESLVESYANYDKLVSEASELRAMLTANGIEPEPLPIYHSLRRDEDVVEEIEGQARKVALILAEHGQTLVDLLAGAQQREKILRSQEARCLRIIDHGELEARTDASGDFAFTMHSQRKTKFACVTRRMSGDGKWEYVGWVFEANGKEILLSNSNCLDRSVLQKLSEARESEDMRLRKAGGVSP